MTSTLNSPTPQLGVPERPLRRSTGGAALGGVCAGLAVRLGVRERNVRIFVVLTCLVWGVGFLGYALAWIFIPRWGESESIAQRLTQSRRESNVLLIALLFALCALVLLGGLARHGSGSVFWPVLLGTVGVVAVWVGSSRDEHSHLEGVLNAAPIVGAASARGWRAFALRVVPGVLFAVIGLRTMHHFGRAWGDVAPSVLGVGILALGAAILLAPWWLDNVRDLSRERRERVRAEEREILATHVHDSVLQTLTLIEKSANSPSDVVRLARAQERELRQWLFAPASAAPSGDAADSFAQQLRRLEDEVEGDYGLTVDVVIVGDCVGDERIGALCAATREAMINAAKWAQVSRISLFGEVESKTISVFVRDTGIGFDLSKVSSDRRGISDSIVTRMRRHGGNAVIRCAPGTGTEVELTLPREVASP